jgi:hypothetical protein
MVINYIEDHLNAGPVKILHHLFELGNLATNCSTACAPGFRSKKTDAVVAPVIGQATFDQMHLVNMLMDRRSSTAVTPKLLR